MLSVRLVAAAVGIVSPACTPAVTAVSNISNVYQPFHVNRC
jgi:hypothetical protein